MMRYRNMSSSKIPVFLLILFICITSVGCAKSSLSMTLEEYPKVDGSTVTIPLSEAVAAEITNVPIDEIRPYILHTKTHNAYVNLIEKKTDLIFVTGPSQEELELAKQNDVTLEIIPIVSEGFVFLTHVENPIDNLSLSDIQKIYTGEIKSWQQLGGDDVEIIAYQRPENSGSQTGFLELVMQGQVPITALSEEVVAEMGMLIDAVALYDNAPASIGYSYYYFVKDMWGNEDVKLLGVDGVMPTPKTISSGDYPLTTAYYAVIRHDSEANSAERKVITWILSDAGQTCMEENGYVKIK